MIFRRPSDLRNFKDIRTQLKRLERILVLEGNEPVAVILGVQDYKSMQSSLQMLGQATNNPEEFQRMMQAHKDFQSGG